MSSTNDKLFRWDPSEDEDETYSEHKQPCAKRRKANSGRTASSVHRVTRASASLSGLLDVFQYGSQIGANLDDTTKGEGESFDSIIEDLLPEYLEARYVTLAQACDIGESGELIRPLSRYETTAILNVVKQSKSSVPSLPDYIISRKLQLRRERRKAGIRDSPAVAISGTSLATLDIPPPSSLPPTVLDSLKAIQTTRHENSFAARICGHKLQKTPGLISVDWETRSPWMNLMDDIHAHYSYSHAEREQTSRLHTPITYVSLQPSHLRQVHELLARVFWDGIDVNDSLQYSPERCTVIAMYGQLVVGAAFLSSPQETYITYMAVRVGWDNTQIATTMLYHLISLNPHRDITLHVSANNPAMLLYNRFGFKAEEFIAGFYEDYLDSNSRASMNAFRLRLRR
ncbi:hypothetical protein PAXRUDRAFT_232092 [Paxillus rubicundulus Ve08.2h10]|uniref:N-acetyltransferase domain-containing protein n=1 Tax=Paxillus rubicundulus Ve08.2h10 TaxID=930991 RepID=A0A0D0E139_9AGAM|nr:hypothetical protein PAXRUDRAFT_232092 [Paxillus rubicundulus Ve08.2h10]